MDISPSFGALKHFLGNADLVPYWNSGYFPGNIIYIYMCASPLLFRGSITIKCEIGQMGIGQWLHQKTNCNKSMVIPGS